MTRLVQRHALLGAVLAVTSIGIAARSGADTEMHGDLPRRAFLGIRYEPGDGGIAIADTLSGGSARALDLRAGDVVTHVGGVPTPDVGAFGAAVSGRHEGEGITLTVSRDGVTRERRGALAGMPLEPSGEHRLVYDVVESGDARLRSMLTIPAGEGPFPAILYIQGLQCSSVEQPIGPPGLTRTFVDALADAGFVVMRCEKSGLGDSTGEPCSEIDLSHEARDFRAALEKLHTYDVVRDDAVFLFGHSMGGVIAPLIATDDLVRGVAVFGTVARPWAEYLIENRRRQARHEPDVDHVALEDELRRTARLHHHLFVEGLGIADIVALHPDLADVATESFPDGVHQYTRHVDFFRELAATSLSAAWSRVTASALAIHGEFDWVTSWDEHVLIAEIVNRYHPGNGEAISIPHMFHGFNLHDSLQSSIASPWTGPFGSAIVTETAAWIERQLSPGDDL